MTIRMKFTNQIIIRKNIESIIDQLVSLCYHQTNLQ